MSEQDTDVLYHLLPGGDRLAYRRVEGTGPGVLFCAGYNSNMQGDKAIHLESLCLQQGWEFTRFDYRGHGESSGEFSRCDISQWRDDALAIIDHVCTGAQIVVGSSMGGWIATLLARARPAKVAGLLTIAAAPDFTEELIWPSLDANIQQTLLEGGVWQMPNHYDDGVSNPVRMSLIESGRRHLVLTETCPVDCPARLLHGSNDTDVPYSLSCRLLERLSGSDVRLTLVKDADHRFSQPENLSLIGATLRELYEAVY